MSVILVSKEARLSRQVSITIKSECVVKTNIFPCVHSIINLKSISFMPVRNCRIWQQVPEPFLFNRYHLMY